MTSEPQKTERSGEADGTNRYKVQITKTHEVIVHATNKREARALVDKYCSPLQNGILYTISVDIRECLDGASSQVDSSHSENVAS
jgi:hypothetical protein